MPESGLGDSFPPLSILFEDSVLLLGVAAVVGEVDVVEVVAAAAGDGGEVFDGATLVVRCFECGVDGLSAEDAGLVSGFPFGFDELWCGVAFELSSGSASCGCTYFVWVVCSPSADAFVDGFLVGFAPGSISFANAFPVGLVVFAPAFTESPFVVCIVFAHILNIVCPIGVVVSAFIVVDFLLVCLAIFVRLRGNVFLVVLVVLAMFGVQLFLVGLTVFSGAFENSLLVGCIVFAGGVFVGGVVLAHAFAVFGFEAFGCAVGCARGCGREFCSTPCACLGLEVSGRHVTPPSGRRPI